MDKSIRLKVCAPAGMMMVMSRELGCDRRIEHQHSAGVREDGVPLANVSLLFDVTLGPGSGAQVTVPVAELDFSGYKFSLENFRGKSHPSGGTGNQTRRSRAASAIRGPRGNPNIDQDTGKKMTRKKSKELADATPEEEQGWSKGLHSAEDAPQIASIDHMPM